MQDILQGERELSKKQVALASSRRALGAQVITGSLVLAAAGIAYIMRDGIVDDSFIYLRVADSILAGSGWVFNQGERANPCTGPLFVVVIAFFRVLGLSGVTSLLLAYFLGLASSIVLLRKALEDRSFVFSVSACLLLLTSITVLSAVGMETHLFIAALLFCAYSFEKKMQMRLGLGLAMLFLLRPDGALMVGVVVLLHFLRERKLPFLALAVSGSLVLPWFVFSFFYFGSILPHSVKIKAIQSQIGFWALAPSYFENFISKSSVPAITCVLLFFGLLSLVEEVRKGRYFSAMVCLFAFLQVSAYVVFKAPVGYFWYNAPSYFAINFLILHGLFFLWHKLPLATRRIPGISSSSVEGPQYVNGLGQPKDFGYLGAALLRSFLLVFVVSEVGAQPLRLGTVSAAERCSILAAAPITQMHSKYRCGQEYREAGLWIDSVADSTAKVATVEIGYLGYYAKREIVDIHGLLHPEAFEAIRAEQVDWWLTAKQPEFVVMHDLQWPGEPMPVEKWFPASGWNHFAEHYSLKRKFGNIHVYVNNAYSLNSATSSS